MVLLPGKGPVERVLPLVPMYSHSPPHINLMLSSSRAKNRDGFGWLAIVSE